MKIKKQESHGANWMDTYGDMVTLLLCFFVLLYSISTIDESKWKALVQSFNPNAIPAATVNPGGDGPSSDSDLGAGVDPNPTPTQEEIDDAMEELYEALKAYAAQTDSGTNIEVTKGDGYVFVSFNDAVFFYGDSYALRPEGEQVLTSVAEILDKASPYIDEIRVMGHTAQAYADRPNNPSNDRFLSSDRATVATIYIQEHATTIAPARIVSVGYGQHRPIDSNETEESRSHNRRVEIAITGFDVLNRLGDSLEQYSTMRAGDAQPAGTSGSQALVDTADDES